jgi:hypothetical protein
MSRILEQIRCGAGQCYYCDRTLYSLSTLEQGLYARTRSLPNARYMVRLHTGCGGGGLLDLLVVPLTLDELGERAICSYLARCCVLNKALQIIFEPVKRRGRQKQRQRKSCTGTDCWS